MTFGVGQINSMSGGELDEIEKRLRPYLEKSCREHGLSMMYFMLTNIMEESTPLMCYGEAAEQLVQEAFGRAPQAGTIWLQGSSRAKSSSFPRLSTQSIRKIADDCIRQGSRMRKNDLRAGLAARGR